MSDAQLVDLIDRAPVYYQPFLQALFLTGWRVMDLAELERSGLTDRGIYLIERKNNVEHLKTWSRTLEEVVAAGIENGDEYAARYKHPIPTRVFTGRYGQPLTYWSISSMMMRLGRPFELRQVRAKAETSAPGTLGHSGQMKRRYTRSVTTKPVK